MVNLINLCSQLLPSVNFITREKRKIQLEKAFFLSHNFIVNIYHMHSVLCFIAVSTESILTHILPSLFYYCLIAGTIDMSDLIGTVLSKYLLLNHWLHTIKHIWKVCHYLFLSLDIKFNVLPTIVLLNRDTSQKQSFGR